MFCPNCGIDDQNSNQFCRSCGTSLNAIRSALEQPDAITTSAVTAREEIGRAIAAKIAEFENAHDLKEAVYEVLPVIERFLESPQERNLSEHEKRQNQVRDGVITSVVGLAIMVSFLLISWIINQEKILVVSALGLLVLLIGLGVTMAALWVPRRLAALSQRISNQIVIDEESNKSNILPDKVPESAQRSNFHPVTEATTRELQRNSTT
jgi:hypothetical protein